MSEKLRKIGIILMYLSIPFNISSIVCSIIGKIPLNLILVSIGISLLSMGSVTKINNPRS
jgi:hypothetical protein